MAVKQKQATDASPTPTPEAARPVGSYQAMYEAAQESGRTKELTAQYFEFKQRGDGFVGLLKARNEVAGKLGGKPYSQYMFETDDGLVKCAFGAATDGDAGQLMTIGSVYSVVFEGQEKIAGGRKVNRFKIVRVVTEQEASVGGPEDIPW